ncbi:hypothetical protein [Cupriavidus sp. UYPR2.512]|uniref:hypothetical protein n=1 Tax=Cupriavidus sp. UYPR2.512 TaxID=1080187 RepID=UPI001E4350EF|nr:hypothetical protein [Cupriavidus sp. UYPR2.512]
MALLLAAVCVVGDVGDAGDVGVDVDVDVPVPGAVVAAVVDVESPPPPPQPATVMTRQASGKAASFMWMRFMDGPPFLCLLIKQKIRWLWQRQR